jgi:hypothetical protein
MELRDISVISSRNIIWALRFDMELWGWRGVIRGRAFKVNLSVGLQRSCILFCILILDSDHFDLTIRGRQQLFQAIAMYSRL